MSDSAAAQRRGDGIIYGSPGVYHYPVEHGIVPSRDLGAGLTEKALCGRAQGIVYDESMKNLWPKDRPCKRCVKAAA